MVGVVVVGIGAAAVGVVDLLLCGVVLVAALVDAPVVVSPFLTFLREGEAIPSGILVSPEYPVETSIVWWGRAVQWNVV